MTPEDPQAYLREINLGAHLEQLPAGPARGRSSTAVLERLDPPGTIGYVRLNIDAARLTAIVGRAGPAAHPRGRSPCPTPCPSARS